MTVPKILYIAGYGRSGSTLLECILAAHPAIAATGERAPYYLLTETADLICSCGEPAVDCEQWGRILSSNSIREKHTLQQLRRFQNLDDARGFVPLLFGSNRQIGSSYGRFHAEFYEAVVETVGSEIRFVCDSSKTSRDTMCRPLALHRLAKLDVHLVHLVRDGRAVLWSNLRGTNQWLEKGIVRRKRFTVIRTIGSWILANLTAEWLGRKIGEERYLRVRYEDLVTSPIEELKRLSDFLETDLNEQAVALREGRLISDAHQLVGNRMRTSKAIQLRLDDEWQSKLPTPWRWVFTVFTRPLLRRYGYLERNRHEAP